MESARCKAFLTSAETGSFTKAAERLNYTPSGVSQLVRALEQELGVSLLNRTRKGVCVTSDGELLLPAVRDFLKQEERIYQTASAIHGVMIGRLTIATYSSVAACWLPGVIQSFEERHPAIQIHLMEGHWKQIDNWIKINQADLAFFSYHEPMEYEWFPLAEIPMVALLPRSHPLAQQDVFPIERFQTERLISYSSEQEDDMKTVFQNNHIQPNIVLSTLESTAMIAMVEQGMGISLTNELVTMCYSNDVAILPLDPPQSITLGLALPSYENASPIVRCFVDHAVRMLSQEEGIRE
ncbi:MAG: LysR family transcriptional regulator [Butyricicoccus sp.]